MIDEQPKLLNGPNKKSLGGPVFDFGPGWGFYVKKWLKKYFLRIIVPTAIIILTVGIFTARRSAENGEKTEGMVGSKKVSVFIIRGDSRALLARKALAEYLKENPQEILTGGQKLFIEETLRRTLNNPKLTIGEVAEFAIDDIKAAIAQAKQLAPSQLKKWEGYAKEVKLD